MKPDAAEAGETPPEETLDQLRALRGLVEGQIKRLMAKLSSPAISSSAVQTKLQDMTRVWVKYDG